ncbi:highly divergent homeobox [Clupea harengus]|uniref:Highly divergent homeobox n=1 Tax=Clupea harengus TaxID=7950 RepID=A0A6P8GW53_CLUHA|nr:highly divergent homeobox [Clupea harengus]
MEAWQDKRSIQTMNLRSVFTPEQQRVLERYYDNGMTNQSKGCFQLILQCAQETKLDFSVVRTWVGNKRRKLASKFDQNGQRLDDMPHGLANHALAGGAGGAGPLGMGLVLSAELAAARSVQRGPSVAHLLPPASCPSSSSSPSSSSPHSSGGGGSSSSSNNNNNNNDVIVTGIYSVGRGSSSSRLDGASTHSRSSTSKPLPPHTPSTRTHTPHTLAQPCGRTTRGSPYRYPTANPHRCSPRPPPHSCTARLGSPTCPETPRQLRPRASPAAGLNSTGRPSPSPSTGPSAALSRRAPRSHQPMLGPLQCTRPPRAALRMSACASSRCSRWRGWLRHSRSWQWGGWRGWREAEGRRSRGPPEDPRDLPTPWRPSPSPWRRPTRTTSTRGRRSWPAWALRCRSDGRRTAAALTARPGRGEAGVEQG